MQSPIKKIIVISFTVFFMFFYIFVALENSYLVHIYYTGILAHSVLLMTICSTAFSIFYFYYKSYAQNKNPLFFAVALFFEMTGISFFFHSITIPTFYFLNEYIFDITEHLGLFFAGAALMILFLPAGSITDFFYNYRKKIVYFVALFSAIKIILFFSSSGFAEEFVKYINLFIFLSGVLMFAGVMRILKMRATMAECKIYSYLVVGLSVLINAAIIPFFYKEWNVLWWYFHMIILIAELIIFIGILRKCDKK